MMRLGLLGRNLFQSNHGVRERSCCNVEQLLRPLAREKRANPHAIVRGLPLDRNGHIAAISPAQRTLGLRYTSPPLIDVVYRGAGSRLAIGNSNLHVVQLAHALAVGPRSGIRRRGGGRWTRRATPCHQKQDSYAQVCQSATARISHERCSEAKETVQGAICASQAMQSIVEK